jgi:thiol-disulfide isomerase/thioredoxin
MKKLLILFISVLSFSQIIAQKQGYEIKVNVKGLQDSTVQLAYYYGDKQYIKDTAVADNKGNILFKGDENLPGGIYIVVMPSKTYFEILVDKEQRFSLETDTTNFIKSMKVKGSKDNEIFYSYLNYIGDKGKEMESLRKEIEAAKGNEQLIEKLKEQQSKTDTEVKDYKRNFINNNRERFLAKVFLSTYEPEIPDAPILENGRKDSLWTFRYYKQHYFDSLDMRDDRLLRTPVFANKIKTYIERLTPQIPDSINAAADYLISLTDPKSEIFKYLVYYITNTYERSKVMGMDAVFVHMAQKYYLNGMTYWVEDHQLEKIKERVDNLKDNLIGNQAVNLKLFKPDFSQTDIYSIKKDFTIVYFWDPSCGHCKKVTPKLSDFYKEKKELYNLEVFAVYSEADTAEWLDYLRKNELKWINAADLLWKTNFKQLYDIYSTPVIYVLDRNKRIIAKRIDVEQLEDFLKNHIKMTKGKL